MKLNSLLSINDLNEYKIHLAQFAGESNPLDAFLEGTFENDWQCWQKKKNFGRKYIFSLIGLGEDEWLFAGIYNVLDCDSLPDSKGYEYDTELTDIYHPLIGRLIIKYSKEFRNNYPNMETCWDDFELSQILKAPYSRV